MAGAGDEMVVDEGDSLHEGVTNRGADEVEAAPAQVVAQRIGFGGSGGDLFHGLPGVLDWLAADEGPEVSVEGAELLLDGKEGFGVLNGGGDFKPVAHNTRGGEGRLGLSGIVFWDFSWGED